MVNFESIERIEESVRETSKIIKHSTPLTTYQNDPQLDLRDIIIAGAISGRNALLSGPTGCAKTHMAELTLAALYGSDNYGKLNTDPSLSEEKLYNIYFGAIKEGETLDNMFQTTKLITAPGALIDDINRAPQEILNCLLAYLNNQATTPGGGKVQPTGIEIDGERYQFKIATCNEGRRYENGTWQMDPAIRRRFAIDVPLNLFAPTEFDNFERRNDIHSGISVPETEGVKDYIIEVYKDLKKIEIHPIVTEFLGYLSRMDNCIKSSFKTKNEKGFDLQRCEGCHARGLAGEQNFCGNAFAPSPATQNDLNAVARAFAALRAYHSDKKSESLEVSLEDAQQAFPFVAATKLGFDPAWLKKYFPSGESFEGAKALAANNEQRIVNKINKLKKYMVKEELTAKDIDVLIKYGNEDPWGVGLRDCDYQPRKVA